MRRTHRSLYYLASYLVVAGVALVLAGPFAMQLLLSNGRYGDVLPRLLGVVLLALCILVVQIIRYRLEMLYATTLAVRALILIVLLWCGVVSGDPFFYVLFAVVGLGVIFTGTSYVLDRRAKEPLTPDLRSTSLSG